MTATPMEARRVTDDYVVTGQITVEHLPIIVEAGFKSVLCTRPDGEDPGQTDFAIIADEARKLGLEARKIDVVGHIGITPENLAEFIDAWEELPRPTFGYCRSGQRAATLHAMTESQIG
ncbi:MAG: sulfur transferase domain-containing protein [Pseudomonadota bacterium]